jgi:hypothetical protein
LSKSLDDFGPLLRKRVLAQELLIGCDCSLAVTNSDEGSRRTNSCSCFFGAGQLSCFGVGGICPAVISQVFVCDSQLRQRHLAKQAIASIG